MMRKQIFLVLTLLVLLVSPSLATELTGKVLWIYDGDTLKIENIGKVRLLGIDTPEYKASPRDHFYKKTSTLRQKNYVKLPGRENNTSSEMSKGKRSGLSLTTREKISTTAYLPISICLVGKC
jgi:micrococcal nuclease